jgi:hypothetical protein
LAELSAELGYEWLRAALMREEPPSAFILFAVAL